MLETKFVHNIIVPKVLHLLISLGVSGRLTYPHHSLIPAQIFGSIAGHLQNSHAHIAAYAEGYAEAETAEEGDVKAGRAGAAGTFATFQTVASVRQPLGGIRARQGLARVL